MDNVNGRGRLIYGCMGLGGSWDNNHYGAAEIDQAAAVIESARGIGIGLFDHADIYRRGKSEAVFGEVLVRSPGLREKIRLQTKCGIRLAEGGRDGHYDLSREAILERVNGSLQRLQTDYVDVLLLHRPDPLMDAREVADAVGQLMAEGKVRHVGVSNMSGAQIAYLQDRLQTPIVANQLEMSLLRRDWLESTVLVNHPKGGRTVFRTGRLSCAWTGASNSRPMVRWRRAGIRERVPTHRQKLRRRRCWSAWRRRRTLLLNQCCLRGS